MDKMIFGIQEVNVFGACEIIYKDYEVFGAGDTLGANFATEVGVNIRPRFYAGSSCAGSRTVRFSHFGGDTDGACDGFQTFAGWYRGDSVDFDFSHAFK